MQVILIALITYKFLYITIQVQRLESKNKAFLETIQEVSSEFFKTEKLLQDDKMKLKQFVMKICKDSDTVSMTSCSIFPLDFVVAINF